MPKGIPKRKYTGEFKQMVAETIVKEKLSSYEAARRFDLSDHSVALRWERIYLEEGAQGLHIERRGRISNLKAGQSKKLDKAVEEDLLEEVQRLRAEVDFLKELDALISQNIQKKK